MVKVGRLLLYVKSYEVEGGGGWVGSSWGMWVDLFWWG